MHIIDLDDKETREMISDDAAMIIEQVLAGVVQFLREIDHAGAADLVAEAAHRFSMKWAEKK